MSDCRHDTLTVFRQEDGPGRMWSCADCSIRFYPACRTCVTVGHREEVHTEAAAAATEGLRAALVRWAPPRVKAMHAYHFDGDGEFVRPDDADEWCVARCHDGGRCDGPCHPDCPTCPDPCPLCLAATERTPEADEDPVPAEQDRATERCWHDYGSGDLCGKTEDECRLTTLHHFQPAPTPERENPFDRAFDEVYR